MLLEELKVMANTSVILQQQLLSNVSNTIADTATEDEFGLPMTLLQQLQKLESDCQDRDLRGRLVCAIVIISDYELLS